jgi:DNA repair protein RecO (recombination protein O)
MQDLKNAYLLHSRPYRDTSLICDLWVDDFGLVPVVARSARGPKSRFRGLLQPFTKLVVSYRGRGPLYSLNSLELAQSLHLPINNLSAGLYLNELVLRSARQASELPYELFAAYEQALESLLQNDIAWPLRVFENNLLRFLGYALQLEKDSSGVAINPDFKYSFIPERGFTRQELAHNTPNTFFGSTIIALRANSKPDIADVRAAKRLLRQALVLLIGSKPLQSSRLTLARYE